MARRNVWAQYWPPPPIPSPPEEEREKTFAVALRCSSTANSAAIKQQGDEKLEWESCRIACDGKWNERVITGLGFFVDYDVSFFVFVGPWLCGFESVHGHATAAAKEQAEQRDEY